MSPTPVNSDKELTTYKTDLPMDKCDYPALLQPGMHTIDMLQLHAHAVAPFPLNQRRIELYGKLRSWIDALHAISITGTLWVDGSFLTEKPSPSDVDCIIWHPRWMPGVVVTPQIQQQASNLLDHGFAQNLYDLDLYAEAPSSPEETFHREAYWRGVLGFGRDRATAKGFVEIKL